MIKEPTRKLDPFTERATSPIYTNYMARWEPEPSTLRRLVAYVSKKSLASFRILCNLL